MSSSDEHSKCKTKKVQCHCPKCKGKFVDQRTQQEHISLADIGKSTKTEMQSHSTKCKHEEEPLSKFQKHSSESEDSGNIYLNSDVSENDEDEEELLPVFQLKIEGSRTEYSNNNSFENNESNNSENEEDSTTSDENEEDSTTSEKDEEGSSDMEDDIISLYLEDDFDGKLLISRKLSKGKFKDVLPAEEDDINLDQPLEISQLYDVYQESDNNESMIIEDEVPDEPDDLPSSSDSSNDLSDSGKSSIDSQEHKSINFIPPEIDPKVFDPLFNFEDNSNDWIIL
ncbi:15039_t:CDS:1 [Dentiscutata heterogama]|uniref:15039_t:CDS:1 n=1 Tax=Dentiscutata heterogama TaxID=1316150 RepID=A0ACA9Q9A5_9GLOM|nr:15039_t:CDS:1 [Dentiscutata heterogama]